MNINENRLDPSLFNPAEMIRLNALVNAEVWSVLIGREGINVELPNPSFHLLVRVIQQMQQGRAIVMLPEHEPFTTQAAANFLSVSRQVFVNQLECGENTHHQVGSHRRGTLKDLLTYQQARDKTRREALGDLFRKLK